MLAALRLSDHTGLDTEKCKGYIAGLAKTMLKTYQGDIYSVFDAACTKLIENLNTIEGEQ